MLWTALVPVKASAFAKSRLDQDPQVRARLSSAFLADVLGVLSQTADIGEILVVTSDAEVAGRVPDAVRIHRPVSKGLNPELSEALALIGRQPAAVIAADLPCLTVAAVTTTLRLAQGFERSFVTDAQGLGTTMLLAKDASVCQPMFGRRSHARHAQAGYAQLQPDSPEAASQLSRVRRDVDTALDLWDAVRLGVGTATTAALALEQ